MGQRQNIQDTCSPEAEIVFIRDQEVIVHVIDKHRSIFSPFFKQKFKSQKQNQDSEIIFFKKQPYLVSNECGVLPIKFKANNLDAKQPIRFNFFVKHQTQKIIYSDSYGELLTNPSEINLQNDNSVDWKNSHDPFWNLLSYDEYDKKRDCSWLAYQDPEMHESDICYVFVIGGYLDYFGLNMHSSNICILLKLRTASKIRHNLN